MLRIDIHAVAQAATLRCTGRIVLGLEAETLRCMVESRAETCLVLDLSEINAIDATGLGLLVELHCRAQRRGQRLRIMAPSACVRRLVELVNLESVLDLVAVDEGRLCNEDDVRSAFARSSLTA